MALYGHKKTPLYLYIVNVLYIVNILYIVTFKVRNSKFRFYKLKYKYDLESDRVN